MHAAAFTKDEFLIHTYYNNIMARILKFSIKKFKRFRNVQKRIETSDDTSVVTLNHHILQGSEVLNPVE